MKRRFLTYRDPLAGAVTAQKSAQVTNQEAVPPVKNPAYDEYGKTRLFYFAHAQSGAGDANSTIDLVKLPPGKFRIIKPCSQFVCSAFGAGATLDIGHTGYTKQDGTAVVAAVDCFSDGADVSAAALKPMGSAGNALGTDPTFLVDSKAGVTIQAKVLGAAIPDAAKLTGFFMVVAE